MMNKGVKKKKALKILITTVSVLLTIAVGIFAAWKFMRISGKSALHSSDDKPSLPILVHTDDTAENNSEIMPEMSEPEPINPAYAEADVVYKGIPYKYNESLINILFMGIDKYSAENGRHQADTLYLAVIDDESKNIDIISISRNTLAYVDEYDISGNYLAAKKEQICLAYSYGTTDEQSSDLTVKAVSGLLYGLPIQGYYTVFMDALPIVTDAVGGVSVTLAEDMTELSPDMTVGVTVKLSGDNVLSYLRKRDSELLGSNEARVSNQKQFIKGFYSAALAAVKKNPTLPATIYNTLQEYSVTDISVGSAVYLAETVLDSKVNEIINIDGIVGTDGKYDTYTANDKNLYEMVLNVFYKKIQ